MKDYKNCLIYKLHSKLCNEIYIGHTTTDIKERFNSHKYYSNINKSKLYNFINENGGIKNWDIEIIEHFPCNNAIEAREREAQMIKLYNSKLNSNIPNQTNKEWRLLNKERYNTYMKEYMRHYKKDEDF